MNKKTLAKFFLVYLSVFIFFIALGIIFKITKFDNYKTHNAGLWTEKNYLANNLLQQNSLYASKEGRVYAWSVPEWFPGSGTINSTVEIYDCVNNNQGFVQCTVTSMLDTVYEPLIGGTFSECKDAIIEVNNKEQVTSTQECNFDESGIAQLLDSSNREVNINQINYKPMNGSIIGVINKAGIEIARESDNIANIAYYNQEMVKEIPLLGPNIIRAAWWEEPLKSLALGPAFFELWKASRNMTYFLIIIPTIAFGFAIMFKMQVGPQTQITLMKALPRILITIIFITFSYPLIALLIQLAKPVADVGVSLIWSFTKSFSFISSTAGASISEYGFVIGAIVGLFRWLWGLLSGGYVLILTLLPFIIIVIIAVIRYLVAVIVNTLKLGFLIGFGPLILLISAFPGREGILKNYFLNVCTHIFGLSLISIMWAMGMAVWMLSWEMGGFVLNFIVAMAGIGIIWKSPSAPKLLATAIGAQPLFEELTGGGQAAGGKRR